MPKIEEATILIDLTPATKNQPVAATRASILQNVSTVLGGSTLARAIGVVTTWILVRHLTPAEYGIFSVLDMVAGLSVGLLTTGFNWSMIKSVAANRNDPLRAWTIARMVFKVEMLYGLVLAVGLYWGADIVAQRLFGKHELAYYLRLCSIGVFGTILLGYRTSIFQAFSQFKRDAAFTFGQSAIYLGIIALLLATGLFDIRVISVAYVGLPLVISMIALFLLRNNLLGNRDGHFLEIFAIVRTSYAWLLCYTLCQWFCSQFHMMILTRYFSLQEVGLYGFSYKIYGLSLMLMTAINVVLLPTFSGVVDRNALKHTFHRVLKATAGVSLLFLVTIPFLGLFVELFAGARYSVATPILQIFIFGAATSTMLSPPVNVLFALDKFTTIARGGLLMVALNLIGHLFITRHFGGAGAACVQVVSHLVLNSYFTLMAYREVQAVH